MIKYTCICPLLYSEAVRNVQKEIRKFRKLENIPHKESLKEWVFKRENWNYSKEIMYSLYPHFTEQDIIGLNCTKVKHSIRNIVWKWCNISTHHCRTLGTDWSNTYGDWSRCSYHTLGSRGQTRPDKFLPAVQCSCCWILLHCLAWMFCRCVKYILLFVSCGYASHPYCLEKQCWFQRITKCQCNSFS